MVSWFDDVGYPVVLTGLTFLPLVGFLSIFVTGRRWTDRCYRLIAVGISLISAIVSVVLWSVSEWSGSLHGSIEWYDWIHISGDPPLIASLSLFADRLSLAVFTVLSLGVAFTLGVSFTLRGSDRDEPAVLCRAECGRAMLLLCSVSLLLFSTNWLTMFLFWQLVGVVGLLPPAGIGEHPEDAATARKIFLFGLGSDVFLLLGILLVFFRYESFDFAASLSLDAQKRVALKTVQVATNGVSVSVMTWCLYAGVAGRCLLIPFLGLAGDLAKDRGANAGLLHAGILMPTGGYLLVRISPLLLTSQETLDWLIWTGAVTVLISVLTAMTQRRLRPLLFALTPGYFGLMFVGVGTGSSSGVFAATMLLLVFPPLMTVVVSSAARSCGELPAGSRPFGRLTGMARRVFYLDEIRDLLVIQPVRILSQLCRFCEWILIDRLLAGLPALISAIFRRGGEPLRNGSVSFYALSVLLATVGLLAVLVWPGD